MYGSHYYLLARQHFQFYVVSMQVNQCSPVRVVAVVGKPHGEILAPQLSPQPHQLLATDHGRALVDVHLFGLEDIFMTTDNKFK